MKNIFLAIALGAAVGGCGRIDLWKKNLTADYGELNRHVVVYDSQSKSVLWEFRGPVYLTDDSKAGNVTVIYKDEAGKTRKNDFIGYHVTVSMKEI